MSWYKVLNNENGTPNPIPLSKTESEKNFFSEKVERIAKSIGLLSLAISYERNDVDVRHHQ